MAVTDAEGRLLNSGLVTTDVELTDWLERFAPEVDVVAIDAPLVVPNQTGQRTCERLIGRAFGRFHASAHTSNRTRPPRHRRSASRCTRTQPWSACGSSRA